MKNHKQSQFVTLIIKVQQNSQRNKFSFQLLALLHVGNKYLSIHKILLCTSEKFIFYSHSAPGFLLILWCFSQKNNFYEHFQQARKKKYSKYPLSASCVPVTLPVMLEDYEMKKTQPLPSNALFGNGKNGSRLGVRQVLK